jgi:hypothetical protein
MCKEPLHEIVRSNGQTSEVKNWCPIHYYACEQITEDWKPLLKSH